MGTRKLSYFYEDEEQSFLEGSVCEWMLLSKEEEGGKNKDATVKENKRGCGNWRETEKHCRKGKGERKGRSFCSNKKRQKKQGMRQALQKRKGKEERKCFWWVGMTRGMKEVMEGETEQVGYTGEEGRPQVKSVVCWFLDVDLIEFYWN